MTTRAVVPMTALGALLTAALLGGCGDSEDDPTPDLGFSAGPISEPTWPVSPGSSVIISFAVINRGLPYTRCSWEIRRLGEVIASGTSSELANRGETVIQVPVSEGSAGTRIYEIRLDPGNTINESHGGGGGENDNTASVTVTWSASG